MKPYRRLRTTLSAPVSGGFYGRRMLHAFDYFDIDYHLLRGYSFPPKSICLIVSEQCNLKCKMCDIGRHNELRGEPSELVASLRSGNDLVSYDEWLRLITDLASLFPKPLILFTGTEPLLYPDILNLMDAALQHKLAVHLTTNGTLLSRYAKALVDLCPKAGTVDITVSIDDIGERHDRIRGVPGTFDRAVAGIHDITDERRRAGKFFPDINITCTVSSYNYRNLESFAAWFLKQKMPISSITFNHLWFKDTRIVQAHNRKAGDRYPVGEENSSAVDIDAIDMDSVQQQINRIRSTLSHGSLRIHQQPPLSAGDARAYYANSCRPVFYDRCTAAWRNITVTPRGNVILSPLCFFPPAGNIKKQPFPELWNAAGFRRLRAEIRQHKMFPACARCCMLFGSRPKYYKIKDWVA